MEEQTIVNWTEILNGGSENRLFVKFGYVVTQNGFRVSEFCVSYRIVDEDEKSTEIIRYDCSEKESPHIHEFWIDQNAKRPINRDNSMRTIEELVSSVKRNWREYRSRFINR